jgi:HEAT repeat protein
MIPDNTDPLMLPLVVAIVAGIAFLALAFVRADRRGRRRRGRRMVRALSRSIADHIEGRLDAVELQRRAEEASEGMFWSALEFGSLRLTRREWLRLSNALGDSRHVREERKALRDNSPWRRALAARRLALLKSPRSRRALRRALVAGPELVSLAAALALARYRDRAALRWLLNHPGALAHRPHPTLVALLRSFGSKSAEELVAALETGIGGESLERAAIEALGLMNWRAARPAIERRLTASDLELRIAAARALGRLAAIECATSLLAALRDEAWQVRAQAARSLGLVRAPIAVQPLARRLTDPVRWVRRHAAFALAEMGEDGRRALKDVIETSPDPYARDMARAALEGRSGLDAA